MPDNDDTKIVELNFPRKDDKNLFTQDEMGEMALLLQKGQQSGLFTRRELIHEKGTSFFAFIGDLDGEEMTYAVVAKQNDTDTGNARYYTRTIGMDAQGHLTIPVDFVYEEFGRVDALLRHDIERGFREQPEPTTTTRFVGNPQSKGPKDPI